MTRRKKAAKKERLPHPDQQTEQNHEQKSSGCVWITLQVAIVPFLLYGLYRFIFEPLMGFVDFGVWEYPHPKLLPLHKRTFYLWGWLDYLIDKLSVCMFGCALVADAKCIYRLIQWLVVYYSGLLHLFVHYFFTVMVATYHIFYDKLQHAYISHIYRHDKYGVVITFAICQFIRIGFHHYDNIIVVLDQKIRDTREMLSTVPTEEELNTIEEIADFNITYFMFLTTIRLVKILVFTFIFKNHTSEQRDHVAIHRFGVVVLGFLAFLTNLVTMGREKFGMGFHLRLLLFSILFKVMGQWSERLAKHEGAELSLKRKLVNFFTMLFEAMAITDTM